MRGSGLLPALFVVVVGALIGAALVRLLGGATQANMLQLSQLRARAAAQSALQWARYRIDRGGGGCVNGAFNLTTGALAGFRVTVTCARTTHDDGGVPRRAYQLSAFAQYGRYGSPDYASHRDRASLVR